MAFSRKVQPQVRVGQAHRFLRCLGIRQVHPQQLVAAPFLWRAGPLAQLFKLRMNSPNPTLMPCRRILGARPPWV
nr:hypothetical protein [Synechococcus sp. MEDNS5]